MSEQVAKDAFLKAAQGYGRAGTAELPGGPDMSMDDAAEVYARLSSLDAELREAAQEAHDTLHECTAVLTANDCKKVAATMTRLRAALSQLLPAPGKAELREVGRAAVERLTPTREAELQAEIERLRGLLIDPGTPAWEDARAVLVAELRKNGMETHAENIAASHPAVIPSWIVLNLIATIRAGRFPGIKDDKHGTETDRPEQSAGAADGSSGLDENTGRGGLRCGEVSGVPEQVTTWGQRLAAAPDCYAPVRTEPGGNFKLLPVVSVLAATPARNTSQIGEG